MGRKRRKIIRRRVVKPPPKVFLCPLCNQEAVTVYHEEGSEYARVSCANCKVSVEVKWLPAYTAVDAFAEFYDVIMGSKKPVEAVASESGSASEIAIEKPEAPVGEVREPEKSAEMDMVGEVIGEKEAGEEKRDVSADRED